MARDRRNKGERLIKNPKMPEQSALYDRIVPIVLVVLGLVAFGLIVFSIGVLTGLIHGS